MHEDLRSNSDSISGLAETMLFLGDIIISVEKAVEQANEHNIAVEDEIVHLFVHGVLHLLGFDHEISPEEEELMQSLESSIIGECSKRIKS